MAARVPKVVPKRCQAFQTEYTMYHQVFWKTFSAFVILVFVFNLVAKILQDYPIPWNGRHKKPNIFQKNGTRNEDLKDSMEKRMEHIILDRINQLQNPMDCKKTKKFICVLKNKCGFGCQVHLLTYCFNVAISLNRTMLINAEKWHYYPQGWNKLFLPASRCRIPRNVQKWPGTRDSDAIMQPWLFAATSYGNATDLKIPKEFRHNVGVFTKNPDLWWIGQLASYLLRPCRKLQRQYKEKRAAIGFRGPYFGFHVRRTDKEMCEQAAVEMYGFALQTFRQRIQNGGENISQIFVATDEVYIGYLLKYTFKDYEVKFDTSSSALAHHNRFSRRSLLGLLSDVYLLVNSDFLICSFTSNICRLAYELRVAQGKDGRKHNFPLNMIYDTSYSLLTNTF